MLHDTARSPRAALVSGALVSGALAAILSPVALAQDGTTDPRVPTPAQPEVAPGGQPDQGQPDQGQPLPLPEGVAGDDEVTFSDFSEPVELRALVQFAVGALNINCAIDEGLNGRVALNAPITIKKSELLVVINSLLEQRGFAMVFDPVSQFYKVIPAASVTPASVGQLATTRVIQTPNVKPSALQTMITTQVAGTLKISYHDDLGLMIVTDTPARLRMIEDLVGLVLKERASMGLTRFDLRYISASTARDRITRLAGGKEQANPLLQQLTGQIPNQAEPAGAQGAAGSLENLNERLIISPQGNALLFRGLAAEVEYVKSLIGLVDVSDRLESRRYLTGSATAQIANLAGQAGLGAFEDLSASALEEAAFNNFGIPPSTFQKSTAGPQGGSRIVIDKDRGFLYYYGTPEQHEELAKIVEAFKADGDIPIIQVYKLRHGDSEKVAELIQNLIDGQRAGAENELLPQQPGIPNPRRSFESGFLGENTGEAVAFPSGEDVFVIADKANNQLVVRAPQRQQAEFAKLIEKLDLRRPQVFVKAQIVAVTASEDFRLAFEQQLLHLADTDIGYNTNFGIGSIAANAGFGAAKTILPASGLVAAVIRSDYVPIAISALQTNTDARVLATPQLLVDDNEEATVASTEVQPFSEFSQGNSTTQQGFGGNAEAGTTLSVTPRISEGGYVNLEFDIEQSAFTGDPTGEGLPPPSQKNTVNSKSVLVPDGMTIVVGGLSVESIRNTILKVPFLGDIPLFGHLFRRTQKATDTTTLYVFLTPQILRDPSFLDMLLVTSGPQAAVELDPDIPALVPSRVELYGAPPVGKDNLPQDTPPTSNPPAPTGG